MSIEHRPPQPYEAAPTNNGGSIGESNATQPDMCMLPPDYLTNPEVGMFTHFRAAIDQIYSYTTAELLKYSPDAENRYTSEDLPSYMTPPIPERLQQLLPILEVTTALLDEQLFGQKLEASFFQERLNPILNKRGLHVTTLSSENSYYMEAHNKGIEKYSLEYPITQSPVVIPSHAARSVPRTYDTSPPPTRMGANEPTKQFITILSTTSSWANAAMHEAGNPTRYSEVTSPYRKRYLELAMALFAANHLMEENLTVSIDGVLWGLEANNNGLDMFSIISMLNDTLRGHGLMIDKIPQSDHTQREVTASPDKPIPPSEQDIELTRLRTRLIELETYDYRNKPTEYYLVNLKRRVLQNEPLSHYDETPADCITHEIYRIAQEARDQATNEEAVQETNALKWAYFALTYSQRGERGQISGIDRYNDYQRNIIEKEGQSAQGITLNAETTQTLIWALHKTGIAYDIEDGPLTVSFEMVEQQMREVASRENMTRSKLPYEDHEAFIHTGHLMRQWQEQEGQET